MKTSIFDTENSSRTRDMSELAIGDFDSRTRKSWLAGCELPGKIAFQEELYIQRRAQVRNDAFTEFD